MTFEARKLYLIRRLIDMNDEALLDKIEQVLDSAAAGDLEAKAWNELTTEQFLQGYAPEDGFYDQL